MQVYEPYMYIYVHMQNNMSITISIKYCAIDLISLSVHCHTHTHTLIYTVTHYAYLLVDSSIVHSLIYYMLYTSIKQHAGYSYQLGCSYHVVLR